MPMFTAVTFPGLAPSAALCAAALCHADRLDRADDRPGFCLVAFRSRAFPWRKRFRVDLRVPAGHSRVEHVRGRYAEDPRAALAQAFDALARRLQRRAAERPPAGAIPMYPVL